MKINKHGLFRLPHLVWLAVLSLAMQFVLTASAAEQFLPVLKTRTGTYTNVTVTTKTKSYIFILHSAGMANIKIDQLPLEALRELGYAVAEDKSNPTIVRAKQFPNQLGATLKPMGAKFRQTFPWSNPAFALNKSVIFIVLGAFLLVHLFFSYCSHLICIKAGKPASPLVWFPVLQWIPLFRAAGMSGWWLLASCVPVLNIVAGIMWSLKIASARGKSVLVGILLILPITNVVAFLYLAFSAGASSDDEPKYKSMALQTA